MPEAPSSSTLAPGCPAPLSPPPAEAPSTQLAPTTPTQPTQATPHLTGHSTYRGGESPASSDSEDSEESEESFISKRESAEATNLELQRVLRSVIECYTRLGIQTGLNTDEVVTPAKNMIIALDGINKYFRSLTPQ